MDPEQPLVPEIRDKTQGANPGFVIFDGQFTFMCKSLFPRIEEFEGFADKQIIVEYIFRGIYQNYLGNHRAPNIRLLHINQMIEEFPNLANQINERNNAINPNNDFYLLSQFLEGFNGNNNILPDFETLLVISLHCGEVDFNVNNIGTVVFNEEMVSAKIDHGQSGTILNNGAFSNYLELVNLHYPELLISRFQLLAACDLVNNNFIIEQIINSLEDLDAALDNNLQFQDALLAEQDLQAIGDNLIGFITPRDEALGEFIAQINALQLVGDQLSINDLYTDLIN